MKPYEKKLEDLLTQLKHLAKEHKLKLAIWVEDDDQTWHNINMSEGDYKKGNCSTALHKIWTAIGYDRVERER